MAPLQTHLHLTGIEREQAVLLSWRVGLLRYKLRPKQALVYDKIKQARPQDIFVNVCSRGYGKTATGATLGLEEIRQPIPGNVIMLSSSLKKLRTIALPTFEFLLDDCPTPYRPVYHSQDSFFTDPVTANNLYLCPAEKGHIKDIRGIHNVKLCLIDEAAFFGSEKDTYPLDYMIDAIITPMFQHSENARVIAYSTPPETPDHPFKDLYEDAKLRGSSALFTIYDSDLHPAKIQEMKERTKDPVVWRREYLCEFVIDANTMIVPEFSVEVHVKEVDEPPYYDLLYKGSGADLGVEDKTYELFGYYDFKRDKIVIKREFWLEGADVRTDFFAAKHQAVVQELKMTHRSLFWSDNSNLMLLNDLISLHHISMNATAKENKAEWLNKVRIDFGEGRYEIDPSCALLIATLQGGYWKDGLKKDYARTKALGHMDAIDALIYFSRNLNRSSNPFPLDYGKNPASHVYPQNWQRQPRTGEGALLQKIFSKDRYKPQAPKREILGGL